MADIDLAEWVRRRAERVKNPSPRTPDRETTSNTADNIERQLQQDGHKIWGFVIYRCTYESDRDWAVFMQRLRQNTRKSLERCNGIDMLESLDIPVMEDRGLFDGLHPSDVLEHFAQWTVTAPLREQGVEARQFESSKRYHYCLHVDKEALQSVLQCGQSTPASSFSYVNLVCRNILVSPLLRADVQNAPLTDVCLREECDQSILKVGMSATSAGCALISDTCFPLGTTTCARVGEITTGYLPKSRCPEPYADDIGPSQVQAQ